MAMASGLLSIRIQSRGDEFDRIEFDHVFDQHLGYDAAAHRVTHRADFGHAVGFFGVVDDVQYIIAHIGHGVEMIILGGSAAAGEIQFRDQNTVFSKTVGDDIIAA